MPEKRVRSSEFQSPLVSVIVLYYKRRGEIERTIRSILQQRYENTEIIVVDNHSEDDLRSVLEPFGTRISLIELAVNCGASGGRNAGIRVATGEILVFLDDDMSLMSPEALGKVVERFASTNDIQVLALRVCEPDTGKLRLREWCHPRYWKEYADLEFETHWFCEGASAFRSEVFQRCGLYYEPLFYGAEGHDLAVRILDHGFRMLYCPEIRVGHRAANEGRSSHRQYYYYTRHFIWMAYKDYQFSDGIRFLVPKLLMMVYFVIRTSSYRSFWRGFWDGIKGLKALAKDRTPASAATVRYWAELDRGRPSLMRRLSRHATEPQI